MAESESTAVPVKVPEPEQHAPPTLAEPASGPVAEMSGALKEADGAEGAKAGANGSSGHAPPSTVSNGAAEKESTDGADKPTETSEKPAVEPAASTEDTQMTDAPDQTAPTAPETNGTASQNKAANGKRKSTGGIPEHKNKKLNKKKSVQKITHLDAQPGDYYIARLKSYPPWPSIICDEDMLPVSLLNTRPVTTKKADGTYNEPYVDGGKKVMDRTFPIMFLSTNEFAWIPNTDLVPLDPAEAKENTPKKGNKQLLAAFEVAAEGHNLKHFKDMLMDHARAIEEDEEAKQAKQAEKTAKADKKKRKSEVKPADDDVEMADGDAEPIAKKASKKRKKDAESEDEETEKPAKTPKTTKLKLTTNKTPVTAEKKAKEPKSAKPKSEKKKAKPSSEEVAEEDKEEQKPQDPKAREKEVLFLRHKLQKGFLTRDQIPREEEMPQMSNYIKKLEGYAELEVSIIRATKINKVLKALIKLPTIPRDEEFQFRKRSVDLLGSWNKILGAEPAEEAGEKDKSPATNGVHDEPEKSEEAAPVDEPTEKLLEPAEAIEKVSGEVPAEAEAKASVIETLEKDGEQSKQDISPEDTKKDEVPAPVDVAPASAEGAAKAQEIVKASE